MKLIFVQLLVTVQNKKEGVRDISVFRNAHTRCKVHPLSSELTSHIVSRFHYNIFNQYYCTFLTKVPRKFQKLTLFQFLTLSSSRLYTYTKYIFLHNIPKALRSQPQYNYVNICLFSWRWQCLVETCSWSAKPNLLLCLDLSFFFDWVQWDT